MGVGATKPRGADGEAHLDNGHAATLLGPVAVVMVTLAANAPTARWCTEPLRKTRSLMTNETSGRKRGIIGHRALLSSNGCSSLGLQLFIAGNVSHALQSEAVADGHHVLRLRVCVTRSVSVALRLGSRQVPKQAGTQRNVPLHAMHEL